MEMVVIYWIVVIDSYCTDFIAGLWCPLKVKYIIAHLFITDKKQNGNTVEAILALELN